MLFIFMVELKLLVVDDDLHSYPTPIALDGAIERLKGESVVWAYDSCRQAEATQILKEAGYRAVMIDNDFGDGVSTLAEVLKMNLPIAYISAYDMDGLRLQFRLIPEARLLSTSTFESGCLTLIRKPGRNVGRDVSLQSLERGIYDFLKSVPKAD
jgi:hypothetical protein